MLGPAAAVIIGAEIAAVVNEGTIKPAQTAEHQRVTAVLEGGDAKDMVALLKSIQDQQSTSDVGAQVALIASNIPFIGDALGNVGPELEAQRQALIDQLHAMGLTDADIKKLQDQQSHATAVAEKSHVEAMAKQNSVIGEFNKAHADAVHGVLTQARRLDEQRAAIERGFQASNSQLGVIAAKDSNINVAAYFNADISVSATQVQRTVSVKVAAARAATGRGFQPA